MRANAVAAMLVGMLLLCGSAATGLALEGEGFAGSDTCAACHRAETEAWSASDHGWALREAIAPNVLGDFNDARLTHKGVTTRFFMMDGHYMVETDGADGKPRQFLVLYTVGVRPLQQYLVETDGGRLQVLDIAWDTRQGRWYHLYPDQDVSAGNGLHWTGSYKNWQARCAACHQTGFEKGYDLPSRTYRSHWAELTVGCESCHGPSAGHVSWARTATDAGTDAVLAPVNRLGPGQGGNELAVCGPCHARREAFAEGSAPVGGAFGDHYNLSLITPGLYFGDGQQNAEVFVLGSFMQSKMMARGVTCSNCHDPHSGGLVAEGNAVCTQCHDDAGRSDFPTLKRQDYDTPTHHHHAAASEAAQCVSCHMPERAYMVIDGRRDHFFRRPDPLQSKAAGAPDVCTGCHAGQSADWAADRIAEWFPEGDRSWQSRAPFIAFDAGDRSPAVFDALIDYARNLDRPAILRATAMEALRDSGVRVAAGEVSPLVGDQSELVRAAAAGLARQLEPSVRLAALKPLLGDPVRIVRHAAATELAGIDPMAMSEAEQKTLNDAIAEYLDSRNAVADTPEGQLAIAGLALSRRNWDDAEAAFKQAVSLDPQLDYAWTMLARLRSALGDERTAEEYLEKGLQYQPQSIRLLFERAGLESRRGNDRAAMDVYRRIVALDGTRTDAWVELAFSALRSNDLVTALDSADKLIALDPANADAYAIAAVARYMQGDLALAKDYGLKARAARPGIQLPVEIERLLGVAN